MRTDRSELAAEPLWELYVLRTRAEEGFAALKEDLGLRPNYLQLEGIADDKDHGRLEDTNDFVGPGMAGP